jgi:hypothetical protein
LGKDLGMLGLAAVVVFGIWKAFDLTDKWLEQKEFEKLDRKIKFLEEKGFSRREISRMVGIPYNEFGVVKDEVVNL